MKGKIFFGIMLIGILLLAGACNAADSASITNPPNNPVPPAPNKYLINISAENFNKEANITKQVEVKSSDIFTIALDSNATTGFQWTTQANIADLAVLQQTAHDYIAPQANVSENPVAGMAGIEEWTFKAGVAGTTKVTLSYDRPWEGGEKGVRTFQLTVVVNK